MDWRKSVDSLVSRVSRIVLPPHCLLCGAAGAGERDLCAACTADLPRNDLCCPRCALPLQTPAQMCGECLRRDPPFTAAWVPFRYGHPLDLLENRLKFGRDLAAGRVLSSLLIELARQQGICLPSAIIAAPLHDQRLRQRGYNQALELARPLARALHVNLSDALLRTRPTLAQTGLRAVQRRRNLRGAFTVREGAHLPAHVAVFDDVMTTGSTLRECARVLRRAGVARVDVWALARAPAPRR